MSSSSKKYFSNKELRSEIPDSNSWHWLEKMGLNDDGSKIYMLDMMIEMEKSPKKKKHLQEIKQQIEEKIADRIILGEAGEE